MTTTNPGFKPEYEYRVFPALGADRETGVVVKAADPIHALKVFHEETGRVAGSRPAQRLTTTTEEK